MGLVLCIIPGNVLAAGDSYFFIIFFFGERTLVAAVVEVHEVLLEITGQSAGINSIAMVLAGDMALSRSQIQSGNVVGAIAIFELNGRGSNSECEKLMSQANAHDRNRRCLHQAAEVVDRLLAMGRVTGAIGDKDSVKVVGNLVYGVVVWEDRHRGAAADKAAQDVLLHTAVDQGNVEGSARSRNNEGGLGAHALDQVDLARIDEALVLIGIVLATDGDTSQRRTLLTEVCDDFSRVHPSNGGNSFTGAPCSKALHSRPMAVFLSNICHDYAGALDVGRFKVLQQIKLVALVRRNAVVSNEGLGKDEDLAAIRRVGHGLGVPNKRCGEDGFSRDVGVRAEGLAVEDRTILQTG